MPFNGSGTFTRIYNWVMDKNQNVKITASRFDNEDDNFASGLSNCITKDGQTVIIQDIPFNSKKITGLASGINIDHAINLGQLQNNQFLYLGTTGGSADAYTLSPNPSITSYATTQQFTVKINASNLTTTPYLQISGITNPSSTAVIKKSNASKTEVALEIGDLLINGIYKFQRNSTNDAWIVLNPEKPFYNLFNATPATNTVLGVQLLSPPLGTIIMASSDFVPTNWLSCNGAAVSRTTYNNLFNLIGITYGSGDGSATFNVPDFRGLFPRGKDAGRGIDLNRTLGSYQDMLIQSHNHFAGGQSETLAGGGAIRYSLVNWSNNINLATSHTGGTETRPKNLAVNFLIKYA
jgi:microcystin-dependent protein